MTATNGLVMNVGRATRLHLLDRRLAILDLPEISSAACAYA
jgi:hypothetical protein